ncbi:MAG: carbohydrate kinase family protein [Proteobacteria bacterium]|uniref:carbohydrate kinase family protein n=1 Tax=Aquabacterium sp. TaxID=1872578 RepID=UPI0035C785E7|nr:carbohydrate kinase family protein [Pseudomonadota bacterium]
MSVLICGSLAFDTITTFPGRFAQQILPEQVHILNVSFLVPSLRKEFGGCAGNIAYSLKQLGGFPRIMATLGKDGTLYRNHIESLGMPLTDVMTVEDDYTAQAIIITDQDNNQITAFHPGAMAQAHLQMIEPNPAIKLAIVSPDGRDAMVQHARQLYAAGIAFVFDPGQGLPMFDGEELKQFIAQATWVTVNDYEGKMLSERTGRSLTEISQSHLQGVVETLGADGCNVYVQGVKTHVPGVKAEAVVDPTGCGDAFRGGLLYGLANGWDLVKSVTLGNRIGALKIAVAGPQNYTLDRTALGL